MRRISLTMILLLTLFAVRANAEEYISKSNPAHSIYYVKLSAAATDAQCMEASRNDYSGTIIYVQQFLNMGNYYLNGKKLTTKDMDALAKAEYDKEIAWRAERERAETENQNNPLAKILMGLTLGWMALGPIIAIIVGAFLLKWFLRWLNITR